MMRTIQRAKYLDLYRSKLHKELDQMQYGRVPYDLPATADEQQRRPVGIWAAAIAVLLVVGFTFGQVF